MTRPRYVLWQEGDFHLGYFEDFPDYLTQGKTIEELRENLRDLYQDIASGGIPYVKTVESKVENISPYSAPQRD